MIQYDIYKGVSAKNAWGALQFSLKLPVLSDNLKEQKSGVVFVNACSSNGPNKYDWSNKFVFALGLTDLGKIIRFFVAGKAKESLKLYHDPDKGKQNEGTRGKTMSFYTQDGCLNGCMITCSTGSGEEQTQHKIPVSGDEVIVLKNLFETAIPAILGWNK